MPVLLSSKSSLLQAVPLKGNNSSYTGHRQQETNTAWQFSASEGEYSVPMDLTWETAGLKVLSQMHRQCQKGAEFPQEYNLSP